MKKPACVAVFVLMCLAGSISAEIKPYNVFGTGVLLAIPDAVNGWKQGDWSVGPGVSYSAVTLFAGVRGTFNLLDRLKLFADVGAFSHDKKAVDAGVSAQGGASYKLPLDLPLQFSVATQLRLYGVASETTVLGTAAEGVVSWECLWVEGLYATASVGPSVSYWDGTGDDVEVGAVVTTGVEYEALDWLNAYSGITYDGTLWTGETGIRLRF